MSGRNLRNFVTHHRTDEAEKLTMRMREGVGSNKYQRVNYDHLRALTASKKIAGQEALLKVKKLQEASRQGKEQQTLKQHKAVWHRELLRLNTLRRRLESEFDTHLVQNMDAPLVDNIYAQFHAYECSLNRNFEKFKKETAEPVWNLREDLQFLLADEYGSRCNTPDSQDEIVGTVKSVKLQQQKILDQLCNEQRALEQELAIGELQEYGRQQSRTVQTGIPADAFELPCPDPRLKASVLQEFILLDSKHLERLEDLEEQHAHLTISDTGGWDPDDHFVFTYIMEQYPSHQVTNRRPLYLDRMKRHLPHIKRDEMVSHEDWWVNYNYYQKRKHALTGDWIRDRAELMNRARVVFAEATHAHNISAVKAEEHGRQQAICDALFEKICEWRSKKLEAMKLEESLEADRRQEMLLRKQEEEEREKERRQQNKEQLLAYHEKLEAQRQREREEQQHRLDVLNEQLAEQAMLDKERVEFRKEKQREKDIERQAQEEQAQIDEAEREERLEALREKVRPNVETDLLRLWSDTEATRARLKEEENVDILKPLYGITTFTSKQVVADPRFRFEAQLRDAGLQESEYARKLMATMKPLHAPRRDMESTLFKQ